MFFFLWYLAVKEFVEVGGAQKKVYSVQHQTM